MSRRSAARDGALTLVLLTQGALLNAATAPSWSRRGPSDVRAVAVTQSAVPIVYAASLSGFYRSDDGGLTFGLVNSTFSGSSSFGFVAVDPFAPRTVYASGAAGFLRSTNAGVDWTASRGLPLEPAGLRRIAAARTMPTTLYSANGFVGNLHRSIDGGATWTSLAPPFTPKGILAVVETRLYASGTIDDGIERVFSSGDGGTTWTVGNELSGGFISSISADPTFPSVVYASTSCCNTFWKSRDLGVHWTEVRSPEYDVEVLLPRAGLVMAGGLGGPSPGGVSPPSGAFYSRDGGLPWIDINAGLQHRAVRFLSANNSGDLFVAVDSEGMLYILTDLVRGNAIQDVPSLMPGGAFLLAAALAAAGVLLIFRPSGPVQ